jgi:integrase
MDEETDNRLVSSGIKAKTGAHSLNTICRRIASLSAAHEALKVENPCRCKEVTILLSKARKAGVKKGLGPTKKKAATRDILEVMLATCKDSLIDIRDRALLLFAFSSGGRRRSEVSGASMENLTLIQGGFLYYLPYSKTDQGGEGNVPSNTRSCSTGFI